MNFLSKNDVQLIRKITDGDKDSFFNEDFFYVKNRDETIRWLYPHSLKTPTFLRFYSSSTLKSKIFIFLTHILFRLKLFNIFFANKIDISVMRNSFLEKILTNSEHKDFSIFFGTVGINRKLIFHLRKYNNASSFIKFSISKESSELINNEYLFINEISKTRNKYLSFPRIIDYKKNNMIELSDLKKRGLFQSGTLDNIHINAALEINANFRESIKWFDLIELYNLNNFYESFNNANIDNDFLNKELLYDFSSTLKNNINLIDDNENILCSMSHGDFTPWNIYIDNEKAYIFDWELASKKRPIFFDLFHFIFQSNTLLENKSYPEFKKQIVSLVKNIKLKDCYKEIGVGIKNNYAFYLIYTSSYYVDLYLKQDKIHIQANWLFTNWNLALQDFYHNNGDIFND